MSFPMETHLCVGKKKYRCPSPSVISRVLFTLYTNESRSNIASINPISKIADDTAILGLINTVIRIKFHTDLKFLNSFKWYNTAYLQLNVNKTKEMAIDCRKKDNKTMPLKINDQIIEQVSIYKYLEVTIDEKLYWSDHINNIKSKANSLFVKKLGQFKVDKILITLSYKSSIESILSFCITFCGGSSSKGDRKKADRIIRISEKFTTHVPHPDELYHKKTLDENNIYLERCKTSAISFS